MRAWYLQIDYKDDTNSTINKRHRRKLESKVNLYQNTIWMLIIFSTLLKVKVSEAN